MPYTLIDFIKKNGLSALKDKYAINAKRHGQYDNLVLFKYNQIESDFHEDIVCKCRGIILDEAKDWRVVCYTFSKFHNFGDPLAAKIDWGTAKVFEKLDGSLAQLHYYDNEWRVSTSGTADASGNVNDFDYTFKTLFWETWEKEGYKLPPDTTMCYAFELCTPFNKIVVQHENSSLTLIGARSLVDFKERNPVIEAHNNGWKCVKVFSFQDKDEILAALEKMNGYTQEGFVVCDRSFSRVKMKNEDYVRKHRLITSSSVRNILDAVRTNEQDEVLIYCTQFKELAADIRMKYEHLVGTIEGFYEGTKHIEQQKDFAMIAKDRKYSGVLFALRHGKVDSVRQALAEMQIKSLEEMLGLKGEADEATIS